MLSDLSLFAALLVAVVTQSRSSADTATQSQAPSTRFPHWSSFNENLPSLPSDSAVEGNSTRLSRTIQVGVMEVGSGDNDGLISIRTTGMPSRGSTTANGASFTIVGLNNTSDARNATTLKGETKGTVDVGQGMQKSVVTEMAISVTDGMNGDTKDVIKVLDSVDGSGEEGSGRIVFSTVSERTPLILKTTSAASSTPTSWTVGQEYVKSSYGFYNPVAPSDDGYSKTEKQKTETTGEGEPFTSRLITPVLVTMMMPHNEFSNEDVQSAESHIAENIPISSSETPVTASLGQLTTSPPTTTFIGDESQSTAQEARKTIHPFLRNDKNILGFNPTKFQGFYTEPTTAPAATKKGQLAIFDLDLSGGGDLSEVTDEPFPPSFRPAFVEELDTMETSKEIETFAITNSQSIHTTDLEPTLRQPSEQEGPKLEYNLSSIQSATDVKWRDERMVVAPIVTTTTTTTVTDSLENTPSATSVSQGLERGLVVTGRPRRSCRLGYRRSNGSCESVCSLSPTYCYNNGRCYMVEGVGPVCKCASAEFSWYRGSRCQSVVTDFQVASVAVAVGLLLFALLVFLLLAFAKRLHVLGAEIRQLRAVKGPCLVTRSHTEGAGDNFSLSTVAAESCGPPAPPAPPPVPPAPPGPPPGRKIIEATLRARTPPLNYYDNMLCQDDTGIKNNKANETCMVTLKTHTTNDISPDGRTRDGGI